MTAFLRCALIVSMFAAATYNPARTQIQPPPDLETRVSTLEHQYADLSAKVDKLSDPLTQSPLRGTAAAPVFAGTVAYAAPLRYTTVCTGSGCAVVPVSSVSYAATSFRTVAYSAPAFTSYSSYTVSDCGAALAVGVPVRRGLFGRCR